MTSRTIRVALLLFGSGFCALIYQTTWLREFRLIFGMSTAASAAVLGIFMAGIGFGGIILGRRSETVERPLRFYAQLEFLIALAAALSVLLIFGARFVYVALGGTKTMGIALGTITRLLLAGIIIGLPTFLMGGTLPAAARSVVGNTDLARRTVGLLYGTNTLGAVVGAIAGTFYCFEHLGNRATLGFAAVLNILIALIAFSLSKSTQPSSPSEPAKPGDEIAITSRFRTRFILGAAGAVGFVFFLMELVWYRMLGPLLGGSTFSFGLILAVALLGIGIGGVAYSFVDPRRVASLGLFAITCAAEALFIGVPYALGDRLAMATMLVRPLGTMGFSGYVLVWTVLCLVVIFPAAVLAGFQFPLLIGLLGSGRNRVGSQIGLAYGWNTMGALAGSLAGGFGLIPFLSAPGVWELTIALLSMIAVVSAGLSYFERHDLSLPAVSIAIVVAALFCETALGPTAFWRHSQIGTGVTAKYEGTPNDFRDLIQMNRRKVVWETDGIESSLALIAVNGLAFFVNGRSDGNAKDDAGTQVMTGLVGAALHPQPTRALVVGLGTGSTAGWLAAVPSMQQVDVVELEPAIRHVAKACAAVNHNALENPKLHLTFGDAREFLLTNHDKYDVVASEPSNPHRAGVAGVFTREFYQAVDARLTEDGIFCQWVQAYDINIPTMESIYRTLHSVFPSIETWQTEESDLLLVASRKPIQYQIDQLRTRLSLEPYRSALIDAWNAECVEDFLAHFVGDESIPVAFENRPGTHLNTDDRTFIEFGLARSIGQKNGFNIAELRSAAHRNRVDRPAQVQGEVDWYRVDEARLSTYAPIYPPADIRAQLKPDEQARAAAFASYTSDDLVSAWQFWKRQTDEPKTLGQLSLVADCLANEGDDSASKYIEKLAETLPIDAEAIRARLLFAQANVSEATKVLEKVFQSLHDDPWPRTGLIDRSLKLAGSIVDADHSRATGIRFYNALRQPLSVHNEDFDRIMTLFNLGVFIDGDKPREYTTAAMQLHEPHVPWNRNFLRIRQLCYTNTQNPKAKDAARDLAEFLRNEPPTVDDLSKDVEHANEKRK